MNNSETSKRAEQSTDESRRDFLGRVSTKPPARFQKFAVAVLSTLLLTAVGSADEGSRGRQR